MRRLLFASLFSVICIFPAPIFAQVPPANTPLPGDRDLIRDRQERLLEEQRRRIEELQQLPGREAQLPPAPPAEDERCFEIKTIRLEGATRISAEQQTALLAPFVNLCLGASQLK